MRLFPGLGDKGAAGTSAPSCNRARGGRGITAGAALQSSEMKEAELLQRGEGQQALCWSGSAVTAPQASHGLAEGAPGLCQDAPAP